MNELVSVLFTGDFCPHGRVEELVKKSQFEAIFGDFLSVLQSTDLNVTDLECPLTTSEYKRKKTGPHQKASPLNAKLLGFGNFQLVALANNHIMDYGEKGVQDTLTELSNYKINFVGLNKNYYESRKPFVFQSKGKKIAIINISENEFVTLPENNFYVNKLNVFDNFVDIQKAKSENQFVVIIFHGGNEHYNLPSPERQKLMRLYVLAGADAIISHHTHCYSGYEIFKGSPIFYGLGNFIYDLPGRINSPWNLGFAVKLIFNETISFEIFPYEQCGLTPGITLLQNENQLFYENLYKLNHIIQDEEKLIKNFKDYCNKISNGYENFLEPNFGKPISFLRLKGAFPKLMGHQKKRLFLNLFRCSTHNEAMVNILKKYEEL